MAVEEKVVALVDVPTNSGENELKNEVSDIQIKVESFVVESDDQYNEAVAFGRVLKQKMAEVTEFFAPMKKSAHDAHKQICDREKRMLEPLKSAEKILKKSVGDYAMKKEQERRAAEEAARKAAMEEMARKLEAAVEAESKGDDEEASAALLDAQIAESASNSIVVADESPKPTGMSVSKDWKITSIDAAKVPVAVNGTVIRPVDEAAVLRLIRASKGKVHIEGVMFEETSKVAFRR